MPTWLHFGSIFRVLGRLGSLLGPLGGVLGASWAVLGHLKASWNQKDEKKALQHKPVLIGTGSAFVCGKRPVPSCRVWC